MPDNPSEIIDFPANSLPLAERKPKETAEIRKVGRQVVIGNDGREYTLATFSNDASLASQLERETIEMLEKVERVAPEGANGEKMQFGEFVRNTRGLHLHALKVLVGGMGAKEVHFDEMSRQYVAIPDYKNQLKAVEIYRDILSEEEERLRKLREKGDGGGDDKPLTPEEFLAESEGGIEQAKLVLERLEKARADAKKAAENKT